MSKKTIAGAAIAVSSLKRLLDHIGGQLANEVKATIESAKDFIDETVKNQLGKKATTKAKAKKGAKKNV